MEPLLTQENNNINNWNNGRNTNQMERWDKLVKKSIRRRCQLDLLVGVNGDKVLTHTKILPQLTASFKLEYKYKDLNTMKSQQLENIKEQFLILAIKEAERDLLNMNNELRVCYMRMNTAGQLPAFQDLMKSTSKNYTQMKDLIVKKHRKKLQYFKGLESQTQTQYMDKRDTWRKQSIEKKRARAKGRKRKRRLDKHIRTRERVKKIIDNNIVLNFSSLDIPDTVYLYLAKGLNFVPSYVSDRVNLKYDALEFIRTLEWKHFFKVNPVLATADHQLTEISKKLKLTSHKHPSTSHPLLEEIKFKTLAFIENLDIGQPQTNLTAAEIRGKNWVLAKLKQKSLFVTKADKGGATLIFDYETVVNTMETELTDATKYAAKRGDLTKSTTAKLKTLCNNLTKSRYISAATNTLITGVTEGNVRAGMKHNPEYKANTPFAYPLYKIHSMNKEEFEAREVPPFRLVYSMKHGPLYRMEKWISCHITPLSKQYCGEEFILDSKHIQNHIKEINNSKLLNNNTTENSYLLFTLDVKALYPSIQPKFAILALENALAQEQDMDLNTKIAIWKFIDFSFKNHFVYYNKMSYKPLKGIPTGGSISRQLADIFLRWLIFVTLKDKIEHWVQVEKWWRFIDDIFGIWKGTKDQFLSFMDKLNKLLEPYGIILDKPQIGRSVNYLDMTVYMVSDSTGDVSLQTKLYRKETDALRFLNRHSFHAPHIFQSVPYSQYLRVGSRNTEQINRDKDIDTLTEGFINANYNRTELSKILDRIKDQGGEAVQRDETAAVDPLIFSLTYFKECSKFKQFITSLKVDITSLIGEHRLIFANRRGPTIADTVVRNKLLCIPKCVTENQKCNAQNCKMCPAIINSTQININGVEFKLANNVNCKTDNVIYYAECSLCTRENGYVGKTLQQLHHRGCGHRNCFTATDHEKSALSMHAMADHQMNCGMENFKFAILKRTHPLNLHREEFRFIEKARVITLGLNRMQVKH